jgi:hypothetical protein
MSKCKRGRPLTAEAQRTRMILVRMSPVELEALDLLRGSLTRAAYLREVLHSNRNSAYGRFLKERRTNATPSKIHPN